MYTLFSAAVNNRTLLSIAPFFSFLVKCKRKLAFIIALMENSGNEVIKFNKRMEVCNFFSYEILPWMNFKPRPFYMEFGF